MAKKKRKRRKGVATHYAYLGGGLHPRKVTKVFNLTGVVVKRRRDLIHKLREAEGEVLAILPDRFKANCDLDELERFLEGEL